MILQINEHLVQLDQEDYEKIGHLNWRVNKIGQPGKFYVLRTDPGKGRSIRMHREILNAGSDNFVDHINGDTLDNRRFNLRLCTNQENLRNRVVSKNNRCGYKGVSKSPRGDGYTARISIGTYQSVEEAAQAYDKVAEFCFKEFAWLNFPRSKE